MTKIVLLGDRDERYLTHRELDSAISLFPPEIDVSWVSTDAANAKESVESANGLWVVPGTPYKNDDVAYEAIRFARTTGQPFLGTCGGFQYAVIEFARNVANWANAAHAETHPSSELKIIEKLSCSLVGEERTIEPVKDTIFSSFLGMDSFSGYHYCNFGLADTYIRDLCQHGLVVAATATDAGVEAIELSDHKFFIAKLFQPQVGASMSKKLSPLIQGFIKASSNNG